jgi:hypothetical protein
MQIPDVLPYRDRFDVGDFADDIKGHQPLSWLRLGRCSTAERPLRDSDCSPRRVWGINTRFSAAPYASAPATGLCGWRSAKSQPSPLFPGYCDDVIGSMLAVKEKFESKIPFL